MILELLALQKCQNTHIFLVRYKIYVLHSVKTYFVSNIKIATNMKKVNKNLKDDEIAYKISFYHPKHLPHFTPLKIIWMSLSD